MKKYIFLFLIIFFSLAFSRPVFAYDCVTNYTSATKNWNDTTAWTGCNSQYPGYNGQTTDTVTIANATALILTGNTTVTVASITFTGGNRADALNVSGGVTITVTGNVAINAPTGTVVKEIAVGTGRLTVNGSTTITGGSQVGRTSSISVTSGIVDLKGGIAFGGSDDRFTAGASSTVNLVGNIGSGAETFTINVASTLSATGTSSISGAYTFGILSVPSGTLSLGAVAITFAGATTLTGGTLDASSATGLKTFTGLVTVTTGTFDLYTASTYATATSFGAGITMNGTTFKSGSGDAAFSASQNIQGSSAMVFEGTVTPASGQTITNSNSGGVTIDGILTLTGNWAQANGGVLTLANATATNGAGTFSASTATNTVNYTGTGQTVKDPNAGTSHVYYHLGLSGSGSNTKTMTSITGITGNLTMAGTAATSGFVVTTIGGNVTMSNTSTLTTGANLAITGNVTVGTGTTLTTGANFTLSVTGWTSVHGTLANSATGAKTYTGLVTVETDGTFTNATNSAITFQGGITNNKASGFSFGTGVINFDTNTQGIGGVESITMASAGVTSAIVVTNNLLLSGSDQLTISTTLGGSGTLRQATGADLHIGATAVAITTLDANTNANTVEYTAAAPTIAPVTYSTLILSGSGNVVMTSVSSILVDFTLSGTVTPTTATGLTVGGNLSIGTNTSLTTGANFTLSVTGWTSVHGTLANSATGAKTYTGLVTVETDGTFTNATNSAITFQGGITNNKASGFSFGTGVINFDTNTQGIGGVESITMASAGIYSVVTNNLLSTGSDYLDITTSLGGSGNLTQGNNADLRIGAATAGLNLTTLTASATGNTVTYNNTSAAQTIKSATYNNLTLANTGRTATLGGAITANGTITIGASCVLASGGYTITAKGSWTNSAGATGFSGGTDKVIFNGTSTVSGTTTFYDFEMAAGSVVHLTSSQTFTVSHNFTSTATSGSHGTMDATSTPTRAVLPVAGTATVDYIDGTDIDSSGGTLVNNYIGGTSTRCLNWYAPTARIMKMIGTGLKISGGGLFRLLNR